MNSAISFSTQRPRRFLSSHAYNAASLPPWKLPEIGANRTETVDSNETLTVGGNRNETIRGMDILMVDLCSIETVGLMKMLNVGLGYLINVGAAMNTLVGASSTEEVVLWKNTMVGKSYTMRAGDEIALKADGKASITLGKPGAAAAGGSGQPGGGASFLLEPDGLAGTGFTPSLGEAALFGPMNTPAVGTAMSALTAAASKQSGTDPSTGGNGTQAQPADKTITAGDQITLTVGKSTIVMDENGKITLTGDVYVKGVFHADKEEECGNDQQNQGQTGHKDDKQQDGKAKDVAGKMQGWLKDWLKSTLGIDDTDGKLSQSILTTLATGIMTTGANVLSGQKVGWSLLGGAISGLTVKDGLLADKLGGIPVGGGLQLGSGVANVALGMVGSAATGATAAKGSGASVSTTVIASVSANFKTDGGTLMAPAPKTPPPAQSADQTGA